MQNIFRRCIMCDLYVSSEDVKTKKARQCSELLCTEFIHHECELGAPKCYHATQTRLGPNNRLSQSKIHPFYCKTHLMKLCDMCNSYRCPNKDHINHGPISYCDACERNLCGPHRNGSNFTREPIDPIYCRECIRTYSQSNEYHSNIKQYIKTNPPQ
jgi:hypothetical protein